MTMKLNELSDELKAAAEAGRPNIPSGPFARAATLEGHTPNIPVDEPPVDGSKLPPITGDVKITMPSDSVATDPQPPITGRMAVTEPLDMVGRRKPKLPATK